MNRSLVAAVVKPRSLLHGPDPPIHIGGCEVHGPNARRYLAVNMELRGVRPTRAPWWAPSPTTSRESSLGHGLVDWPAC